MASTRGEVKGSQATARTTFLIKYGMGMRRDRARSKIEVPRANSRGRFCSSRFQLPNFIKNGSHTGEICEMLGALTMADNNKRVR